MGKFKVSVRVYFKLEFKLMIELHFSIDWDQNLGVGWGILE